MTSQDLVVIATTPGREMWVAEIMSTISRPCIVVSGWGFELGKIRWVLENTRAERFLFLQDSMVIKDQSLFDLVFEGPGSACVLEGDFCYNGFVGVYERRVLEQVGVPVCDSKEESVRLEAEWTREYQEACDIVRHPLEADVLDFVSIRKNGRDNLVRVNRFFEKWYGTWGTDQLHKEVESFRQFESIEIQLRSQSNLIRHLEKENKYLRQKLIHRLIAAFRAFVS